MEPDLLLLAADEGDDELLVIFELMVEQNETAKFRFDFERFSEEEYTALFRFQKNDIMRLKDAMQFPEQLYAYNGTKAAGIECLCLLLRRLAYPNRLTDLSAIFGRNVEELSLLFNLAVEHVYRRFGHLVGNLNHTRMMYSQANLRRYADAIYNKGAPLRNCWGFIDGTARPICKPSVHQKVVYSGHKRIHALKFQSVVLPNGIIGHMFGPIEGRRHDAAMLAESGILGILEQMSDENGQPFYLYGDAGYPLRPQILSPFRGSNITDQEKNFNKEMSKVRECVEWGFGEIVTQFAFLDFKKNLKLYLQPVGKYYLVATILVNCRTCLYGNITSHFFGLEPPILETYLNDEL